MGSPKELIDSCCILSKNDLMNLTILKKITRVIVHEVNPKSIILFGSHATGRANPESDLDLLIVTRDSFQKGRSRRQQMLKIWKALLSFKMGKDILVFSQQEVKEWKNVKNHIISRALSQGRILYEQS